MAKVNERFKRITAKMGGPHAVASLLSISVTHVYFLSSGKRNPSRPLMAKIKNEMGIPPTAWVESVGGAP